MKRLMKEVIVSGFTLVVSANAVFAQYVLTFDENGHGTVNGQPLGFTVGPDPTGGILSSPVLMYTLPFDTQPGDVSLLEPASPNAPISDVIRFFEPTPGGPTSLLIFYSDFEPTEQLDLADVGLPTSAGTFTIAETGLEGNNGAVWVPSLPEPGTPLLGGPVTGTAQYNIISDIPEPGEGGLLLAGVIVLGAMRWLLRRDGPAAVATALRTLGL
jgi:hypothetical protein